MAALTTAEKFPTGVTHHWWLFLETTVCPSHDIRRNTDTAHVPHYATHMSVAGSGVSLNQSIDVGSVAAETLVLSRCHHGLI